MGFTNYISQAGNIPAKSSSSNLGMMQFVGSDSEVYYEDGALTEYPTKGYTSQVLSAPGAISSNSILSANTGWTSSLTGSQVSCMNAWGAGTNPGGNIANAQNLHGYIGNVRA